jgi:SAM-dependent methyltransferase
MKHITECRACGDEDLRLVLDLGYQPLANRFVTEEQCEWQEPDYPLHLVRCLTCGLAQLDTVVDPKILYGPSYPYRSGYSEGWRKHCEALAEEIGPGKAVLDIGCLDGVLLQACHAHGSIGMGCDPSGTQPFVQQKLFDRDTRFPQPFDVIVAQNVFGHVDDAKGFLEGVAENLAPHGQAIIEVPWIASLWAHGKWDSVYHEHLSYWGIRSMIWALDGTGLRLREVKGFPDIHGSSLRYYIEHGEAEEVGIPGVDGRLQTENAFSLNTADGITLAAHAKRDIDYWDAYLQNPQRKAIAAYGASAKLNTFLNALPNRPSIIGVFDDNPNKWNLYTPGHHFPVLKPTEATMREVEVLLIGAGNWHDEIERKAEALGFKGEVVSLWR